MFGSPETQPGGRALKFYSSQRLDIRRIETLKEGTEAVGNRVQVKVVKNKVAAPFRIAEFDIDFGKGISRSGCILDLGLEHDLISKSGSFFSYGDERIGQGRNNAKGHLVENPEVAPGRSRRRSTPPWSRGDDATRAFGSPVEYIRAIFLLRAKQAENLEEASWRKSRSNTNLVRRSLIQPEGSSACQSGGVCCGGQPGGGGTSKKSGPWRGGVLPSRKQAGRGLPGDEGRARRARRRGLRPTPRDAATTTKGRARHELPAEAPRRPATATGVDPIPAGASPPLA